MVSYLQKPAAYRSSRVADLNWSNNFSDGLCFYWQGNDRGLLGKELVKKQNTSFSFGNKSGWSVTDNKDVGSTWVSDATNGWQNQLGWTTNGMYQKPVKMLTQIIRLNINSLPDGNAEFMGGGQGFSIKSDSTNPGVFYLQLSTSSGYFFLPTSAQHYGSWVWYVARYWSWGQSFPNANMDFTVWDDHGNILDQIIRFNGNPGDTISYPGGAAFIKGFDAKFDLAAYWNVKWSDTKVRQFIYDRGRSLGTPRSRRPLVFTQPSGVSTTLVGVSATGVVHAPTVTTSSGTQISCPSVFSTGTTGTPSIAITTNALSGVFATGALSNPSINTSSLIIEAYPTAVSIPISVTLDNLPTGQAQQSGAVFNNVGLFDDAFVRISVMGTTFSNGFLDVYVYAAVDGQNYQFTDGCTGLDSTYTLPVLNLIPFTRLKIIGAASSISCPTGIANLFGDKMPEAWGLVFVNRTGAPLGTGNTAVYNGKTYSFVSSAFGAATQTASLTGLPAKGGIGTATIQQVNYVPPTKSGYTLTRDYAAGTTVNNSTDLDNAFYWYAFPNNVLGAPIPPAILGLNYGLVFDEEFNVLDLGTTGSHRWYQGPFTEPLGATNNISVSNSILQLTWRSGQANNDTSIFTAALDRSQGTGWYLGYWEWFAKCDMGSGSLPSFGGLSLPHLLGKDFFGGVEEFAQINISLSGHAPTVVTETSDYSTGAAPPYTVTHFGTTKSVTAIAGTDWHKYAMKWSAGQVTFYMDDVALDTVATNANTDANKDALAIFLSAGWDGVNGPTGAPFSIFVDWFRIWQPNQTSTALPQGNDWEQLSQSATNRFVDSTAMHLVATLPAGTTGFNTNSHVCTPSGQPIQSGLLQTVYNQYFGYWEANILVQSARGGNPRFYLVPNSGTIPPEIVVAEWGNNGVLTTNSSIHPCIAADGETFTYSNTSTNYNKTTDVYSPGFNYSLGFHTVAVDWSNGSVTHYVDGVLITSRTFNWVTSNGGDPGPAAAVLVMAIGNSFGGDPQTVGSFPQAMQVKFLRIWQKNPVALAAPNLGTSVDGTTNPPIIPLVDSGQNQWTLINGQIAQNGVVDTTTSNVTLLLYYHGMIYQQAFGVFWGWAQNGHWIFTANGQGDPRTSFTVSANGSTTSNANTTITDGIGDTWTINASGQIVHNGISDTTTGQLQLILYYNANVYQEAAGGKWWIWSGNPASWVQISGDPRLVQTQYPRPNNLPAQPVPPAPISGLGLTCTFNEDFTTNPLTNGNWRDGNFQIAPITAASYFVWDGSSVIDLTVDNTVTNVCLATAGIKDFGPGYYEIKARWSNDPAQSIALWLTSDQHNAYNNTGTFTDCYPNGPGGNTFETWGEWDIVKWCQQLFGNNTIITQATQHWAQVSGVCNPALGAQFDQPAFNQGAQTKGQLLGKGNNVLLTNFDPTQFHVYSVLWTQGFPSGTFKWFVDGTLVTQVTIANDLIYPAGRSYQVQIEQQPYFFTLQNALNGTPGTVPQHLYVDYVRAWQNLVPATPAPVANSVSITAQVNSSNDNVPVSVTGTFNTILVASQPAHGTASAVGTTLSYTPAANFTGSDSFTYEAIGPGGTSAPATVAVNVANANVVFHALSSYANNAVSIKNALAPRNYDCYFAFTTPFSDVGNPNQNVGILPWVVSYYAVPSNGTLKDAANGAYDASWRAQSQQMASNNNLAAIRVCWEMNGGFFQHGVIDPRNTPNGNAAQNSIYYVQMFRRFVNIFRPLNPRVLIDWCVNGGVSPVSISACYPGDDVVDIIGNDLYQGGGQGWSDFISLSNMPDDDFHAGLLWQTNFANSTHGINAPAGQTGGKKMLSWPEWAGDANQASVTGENFITPMINLAKSKGTQFAYQNTWDSSGSSAVPLTPGSDAFNAYVNAYKGTTYGGTMPISKPPGF